MRSLRCQLLAYLLAVIYGLAGTAGPALHSLPGLDHFAHADDSSADGARSCGCCCDHGELGPDEHGPISSAGATADQCPLCQFLALGQDRPAQPPLLSSGKPLTSAFVPAASVCEAAPLRKLCARGPPATAPFV